MSPLNGIAAIQKFFSDNAVPIFYISKTPYNALGLERLVSNFWYISEVAMFGEAVLPLFTPPGMTGVESGIEETNSILLANPAVRAFIAEKGKPAKALFLMFSEENASQVRSLGLDLAFPSATFRSQLDNKLATTRLGVEAQTRSVPNIITKITGYSDLRRLTSHLGQDLVIQLPFGDSGQTTYFVADQASYETCAVSVEAQAEVKIMRRIDCRQAAIEACVTRHGLVIGPLATELVGFDTLTPYRGGWCGNEMGANCFTENIIREARAMTQRFGTALQNRGYRGCFGLDLLIDEQTGDIFLGELNPRMTGLSPLTTQVAKEQGNLPLMLLHLLEWLALDYQIDVEELNHRWIQQQPSKVWSQLILKHMEQTPKLIEATPLSGRYRKQAGATMALQGIDAQLERLDNADEALILRTVNEGWMCRQGDCLARMLTPGRVMDSSYQLLAETNQWIAAIRSSFLLT